MKGNQCIYNSSWYYEEIIWQEEAGLLAISNINRPVYGDMTIVCTKPTDKGDRIILFRYWVHTHFLPITVSGEGSIGSSTVSDYNDDYNLILVSSLAYDLHYIQ